MTTPITIALSKGHILRRLFLCIKSAEIIMQDNPNQSKALIFSINHPNIRLLMVRREVIYPLMYVVVLQIVGS